MRMYAASPLASGAPAEASGWPQAGPREAKSGHERPRTVLGAPMGGPEGPEAICVPRPWGAQGRGT
eukprot:3521116-Pyramimonas_sp.AAC.1